MKATYTLTCTLSHQHPMAEDEYRSHVIGIAVALQAIQRTFPKINIDVTTGAQHVGVVDVYEFHRKFQVPMSPVPAFLDPAAYEFRLKFLKEELMEFKDSCASGNYEGAADALIDLVYVAIGTALMMGVPWPSMWQEVQHANMRKELAKPDGSNSKRGSPLDVVKPDGWRKPNHKQHLPKGPVPTFNATAAIAALAAHRRDGTPLPALQEFLELPGIPEPIANND